MIFAAQAHLFDDAPMTSGAMFDPTRSYRYRLWRAWGDGQRVLFIMLNPSTADEHVLDPTVAKCLRLARRWGYARLDVGNIFAWRSTDPRALYTLDDPVGPENDWHLVEMAREADRVIAAWGTHGALYERGDKVLRMLRNEGVEVLCLARTKAGLPGHPLYLKETLVPEPLTP